MKKEIKLVLALSVLSVAFYVLNYMIFGRAEDILFYLVEDVAFLFVQVLLVTLVIQRVLDQRDKALRREKMNMVIGAFFSEVGTSLLSLFSEWGPDRVKMAEELKVDQAWTARNFARSLRWLDGYSYEADLKKADWMQLKALLLSRREFMLRLMENQNLLEHEDFTGLMQAVFHLTEELLARSDLTTLPAPDLLHLAGDVKRVYLPLVRQWLHYMRHLQTHYSYLFSLAARTNPFDKKRLGHRPGAMIPFAGSSRRLTERYQAFTGLTLFMGGHLDGGVGFDDDAEADIEDSLPRLVAAPGRRGGAVRAVPERAAAHNALANNFSRCGVAAVVVAVRIGLEK
ncbi:MAG: hypothetical protein WCK89_18845 [bacterium]